jgi:hypothetical protein
MSLIRNTAGENAYVTATIVVFCYFSVNPPVKGVTSAVLL